MAIANAGAEHAVVGVDRTAVGQGSAGRAVGCGDSCAGGCASGARTTRLRACAMPRSLANTMQPSREES